MGFKSPWDSNHHLGDYFWSCFPITQQSKNFPTYPERNIPKRPESPTLDVSEFLNHLVVVKGMPGVCETGVCSRGMLGFS